MGGFSQVLAAAQAFTDALPELQAAAQKFNEARPALEANVPRIQRCFSLYDAIVGRQPAEDGQIDRFIREDLKLFGTSAWEKATLREETEQVLLDREYGRLAMWQDPVRFIGLRVRSKFRALHPGTCHTRKLMGDRSPTNETQAPRDLADLVCKVALQEVCVRAGFTPKEIRILVGRFQGAWRKWPEAANIYSLSDLEARRIWERLKRKGPDLVYALTAVEGAKKIF